MRTSGPARAKSPGRKGDSTGDSTAQQNSEPASSPWIVWIRSNLLWFYWFFFDMVLPILRLNKRLETCVYGLLLPTLPTDVKERMRQDALEDLGLKDGATEQEISNAFRALSFKYHPDKNKQPNAAVEFKKVNAANEYLTKDPIPLDLRDATRCLASEIVKFVVTMLVLICFRYNPVSGGDVFMMNPNTIRAFGRTYAQWPSLMSIILSTVIMYCMGGIWRFPTVMIFRENFYICNFIQGVLMWIYWILASMVDCKWFLYISWPLALLAWLFIRIIWMIMFFLSNTLRFCDNCWPFHFIPISHFVNFVWKFHVWCIYTLAFYNMYNPSQAKVLSNVLLTFRLIAVMGVLLVWARM